MKCVDEPKFKCSYPKKCEEIRRCKNGPGHDSIIADQIAEYAMLQKDNVNMYSAVRQRARELLKGKTR